MGSIAHPPLSEPTHYPSEKACVSLISSLSCSLQRMWPALSERSPQLSELGERAQRNSHALTFLRQRVSLEKKKNTFFIISFLKSTQLMPSLKHN